MEAIMKLSIPLALACVVLTTPAVAAGSHCHDDIKAVDAAVASAKVADVDKEKAKAALSKADELHKANKEEDCEKTVAEARKLLGMKSSH